MYLQVHAVHSALQHRDESHTAEAALSLVGDGSLQVVVAMMEPLQEGGQVASSAVKVVEAALLEAQDIVQDHLLGVPPLPLEIDALGRFCCQTLALC